jgi:hypothetical protein
LLVPWFNQFPQFIQTDLTLCSLSSVLDSAWHHVAVERRRSDGNLWLFVDGNLEAQATGPAGDISYPDAVGGANANDPYLVLGAEKYDTGHPYSGWLDELRISTKLRYTASFSRPRAPFVADRFTAALYHFDDGDGATLYDVSGAFHSPSPGLIKRGGAGNGPAWMPDSPFNVGGLVNNAPPFHVHRIAHVTLNLHSPGALSLFPAAGTPIEDPGAACNLDLSTLTAIGKKTVMLGVIDVGETDVESVESLVLRGHEALRYIARGQLILAPDCGMLELTHASARKKLLNLSLAASRITESAAS